MKRNINTNINVVKLQNLLNVSQERFTEDLNAAGLKCHRSLISHWEAGRQGLSLNAIEVICRTWEIPTDLFLYGNVNEIKRA